MRLLVVLTFLAAADPSAILRQATRVVETDRAAERQAALRSLLRADPRNRASLFELATLERLTYQPDSARRHYQPLLDGGDRLATAAAIGLGQLDIAAGRWEGLGARLESASATALTLGDSSLAALALLELAPVATRSGKGLDGDTLLARVRRFLPVRDTVLWARLHCLAAGPPRTEGELSESDEALAGLRLAQLSRDRRTEAFCLGSHAKALFREGRHDSAVAVNAQAITLLQSTRDGAGLAASLQWQGYALLAAREYGQARRTLLAAIDASRASGNWLPAISSYTSLASLSVRFGELGAARRYAATGDSLAVALGAERVRAGLMSVRGDVARASGDTAAARAFYLDALARSGNSGYGAVAPYRGLAALARDRGDFTDAERQLAEAKRIADKQGMAEWGRRLAYDAGGVALARGDLEGAERAYETFLQSLPAADRALAFPARLHLAEIAARTREVLRGDSLARAAFDDLDAWRASADDRTLRLHALALRELDLEQGLGVATLVSRLAAAGRADAAFSLAERARGRLIDDRSLTLSTWSGTNRKATSTRRTSPGATLPEGMAVIEFVTGEGPDAGVALIVTRDGIAAVEGPASRDLAATAARFRTLVEGGADPMRLDRSLTTTLVGQAFEKLPPGITSVAVVPDGPLYRIPFDALRVGDGLLVDRAAVAVVPSATLVFGGPRPAAPWRVLAIANPATPLAGGHSAETATYWRAFSDAGGLPPLPASAREARFATRLASGSVLRTGSGASEWYARQPGIGEFTLIHVAAHAVVSDDDLGGSALALAPGSGLDGFLTAGDLAGLKLNAELVVLSGCRTAGGVVIAGEGIQGLTAPLLAAGSRRVLATGWRIRDGDAARFMEYFYRELPLDGEVGAALRRAKLAARSDGMTAAVWGAFVLAGDPLGGFVPRPVKASVSGR